MSRKDSFKSKCDRRAPRRDRPSQNCPQGFHSWELIKPYAQMKPEQKRFLNKITNAVDQVYTVLRAGAALNVCLDIPDGTPIEGVNLVLTAAMERLEREGLQPPATIALNFYREGDL